MSDPKITEKELAKALDDGMDNMLDSTGEIDTLTLARRAAELLGVDLAPDNPEPGTWHIVTDEPNAGKVARANEFGGLSLYGDEGQVWTYTDCDSWPTLTPAVVLAKDELEVIQQTTRALRDKVKTAESRVSELRAELAGANETLAELMPAEPMEDARSRAVDIIEEVVKNHIRVRLNIADTGGENAHSGTINQIRHLHLAEPHLPAVEAANRLRDAGVLSALAKHGEARELPGRDEVRAIISNLGSHRATTDSITDALMSLLGGGDHD